MVEIYTDGACIGNPGPGGWGVLLVEDDQQRSFSGHEPRTTNQRMELVAAIKGLEAAPTGAEATVYSDSQYLVKTMSQGWKRQANRDLWEQLDKLVGVRKVRWEWIKGHAGHPLQEQANTLAYSAAHGRTEIPQNNAEGPLKLTHVDASGRARMVDVTQKGDTHREAIAKGSVVMKPATLALIREGAVAKGDVLAVAQVAGIMAAKQTPNLIPMCHPLSLTEIKVDFQLDDAHSSVDITAAVKSVGKTGFEMEALTAVAVAALTIYDMCKGVDRAMRIEGVRLVKKSGGKSGTILLE